LYFVSFYGITDEFHQSFVIGRSSDLVDWSADVTGGAIGAAVYLLLRSKKHS
jgi:VanZ family protein